MRVYGFAAAAKSGYRRVDAMSRGLPTQIDPALPRQPQNVNQNRALQLLFGILALNIGFFANLHFSVSEAIGAAKQMR